MLVLIEGSYGGCEYAIMFKAFGIDTTDNIAKADLVCFTGGSDVTPSMYKQAKHPTTYNNVERDKHCMDLFNQCVERDIPMVGICRGSQFLCVANKGTLWQDIDGHLGDHWALTIGGDVIRVTSTHHQEMNPVHGKILMTAQSGSTRSYMNADGVQATVGKTTPTVEAVYWEHTRSLGVQGHPEFRSAGGEFRKWFMEQVGALMEGDI